MKHEKNKLNMESERFKKIAKHIRLRILEMVHRSKSSHIGSSFSCVELLVALYFKTMKIDPRYPQDPNRDRFILSKGHAAAVLYATLGERGFFEKDILDDYYANGSTLAGHVSRSAVPGVEVSTGSLGHGLPIAAGMAYAGKCDKNIYRVFALLSDGECDEGSVWEAILFAGHHKLDNLVVMVDYNKWQSFGRTKEVLDLEPFSQKWSNFGWSVKEADGHNFKEIFDVLANIPFQKGRPSVLIAHTRKAKGLSFMEDKLESHYRPPTDAEHGLAIREIQNS